LVKLMQNHFLARGGGLGVGHSITHERRVPGAPEARRSSKSTDPLFHKIAARSPILEILLLQRTGTLGPHPSAISTDPLIGPNSALSYCAAKDGSGVTYNGGMFSLYGVQSRGNIEGQLGW